MDCYCCLRQPGMCCLCILAVGTIVHSGLRPWRRIQSLPARADAIPIKINCLKSGPASSVAKERKISVAHERTAGAESHLAPAAALWQQRFRDASGGCSRILCYTGVLGTGTGRNLEQRVAPCLCVENSHSFLKESTCV